MKFTKIPADTFRNLQMNAGILLDGFTPSTGVIGNIIGATSGGANFTATPEFSDFGEDIDNCPKNMKELKKLTRWEAIMSGTFVAVTLATAKMLVGAADIDANDNTHIIPRNDILDADFDDVWWVGDYSDKNGDTNGGFLAIHLINALSTTGFQIQSGDKTKGTFSFEFTGHYSMNEQDKVPFEIYIVEGEEEVPPTYSVASVTGFEYGVTYYIKNQYNQYVEVTKGAKFNESETYYTKD